MKTPTRLSPFNAIAIGLAGFFLLRWALHGLGQALDLSDSATHVLLKILLLGITLVVARSHPSGLERLGSRKPQGKSWIFVAIIGGAMGALTTLVMLLVRAESHPLMQQLSLPEVVLTIWLLSSVSEEFYCRGLIQPWMDDGNDRHWTHPATLASAFIFGAMHLSLLFDGASPITACIIITATTLLGLLCAATRRASRSVWAAIATHVLFNVGGVVGGILGVLIFGSEILSTRL